MNVLIIFPNLNAEEGFNHGVACLSGQLKAAGHAVTLINLNEKLSVVPTIPELIERIRTLGPGLIAFSVQTMQYAYACQLQEAISAAFPTLPIVMGGVHASLCLKDLIAEKRWPMIGYGECDEMLPALATRLERSEDISDLPNLAIRSADGSYRVNPLGPYPKLETLAPEDYEIFDLDSMLACKNGWMSVLTSRGCPYRCTYCFNYELSGKYAAEGHPRRNYLRRYPVDRVIREIRELVDRHAGLETIIFDDDLFTQDSEWVVEFCRAYREAKIDRPFVVNAHVQSFSDAAAEALGQSPCRIVKFGVESGSEALRRAFLRRFMTNEKIAEAFALCEKHDLQSSAFLMVGMPGESIDQMNETIDLMVRVRPGRMRWSVFYPFPGTESYTLAEQAGAIDHDRLAKLENYFVSTCLKFDVPTETFLSKLQRVFHWYVNARLDWPAAPIYREQLAKIEKVPLAEWPAMRDEVLKLDRRISDELLAKDIDHYSLRFTEVMAVHSRWLKIERKEYSNQAAKTWK